MVIATGERTISAQPEVEHTHTHTRETSYLLFMLLETPVSEYFIFKLGICVIATTGAVMLEPSASHMLVIARMITHCIITTAATSVRVLHATVVVPVGCEGRDLHRALCCCGGSRHRRRGWQ